MATLHITRENFKQEVINSEKPVLIDFWASWCGPCKMLAPVIEEISNEVKKAKICKINVDEQPELAARFNIMSIPTLVAIKDGKIIDSAIGLRSKSDILDLIK